MVTVLDQNSVVQRVGELASAAMGNELAMMDLDTGKYLVLDKVAAHIWRTLIARSVSGT
jgi:hypothetical protein